MVRCLIAASEASLVASGPKYLEKSTLYIMGLWAVGSRMVNVGLPASPAVPSGMGYLLGSSSRRRLRHRSPSNTPPPPSSTSRGAFVVASDASPLDGGPSLSLSAAVADGAYVLTRRPVLLGSSASIPLVRLREAAASPTPVDLAKG